MLIIYPATMLIIDAFNNSIQQFYREFHATWLFSFFCVGISIGLIAIFRKKFNTQGKVTSFISENAFGVYVFHTPILVAITMALSSIENESCS